MELIEKILEDLTNRIVTQKNLEEQYLESKGNSNGFEKLMKDKIMPEFNRDSPQKFSEKVKLSGRFGHHFPDIDIHTEEGIYGLELKSRNNGSWQTLGGSVFDKNSEDFEDYKEIYLLFASRNKNETSYKVRCMPYWKASSAIKVTHKPRFEINLDSDINVFKSKTEYTKFRNSSDDQINEFVQDYLLKHTNSSTWYINSQEEIAPTRYSDLDSENKEDIYTELLILFPNDLLQVLPNGKARANYDNLQSYLITQHYILISRDQFSAGGKELIRGVEFPRIVNNYIKYKDSILSMLRSDNPDFAEIAYEKWNQPDFPKTTLEKDFKEFLDRCGKKYLSELLAQININKLSELIFQ